MMDEGGCGGVCSCARIQSGERGRSCLGIVRAKGG